MFTDTAVNSSLAPPCAPAPAVMTTKRQRHQRNVRSKRSESFLTCLSALPSAHCRLPTADCRLLVCLSSARGHRHGVGDDAAVVERLRRPVVVVDDRGERADLIGRQLNGVVITIQRTPSEQGGVVSEPS